MRLIKNRLFITAASLVWLTACGNGENSDSRQTSREPDPYHDCVRMLASDGVPANDAKIICYRRFH